MHRSTLRFTLLVLLVLALAAPATAADHRLGFGLHFWKTVDDLADDGFDDVEEDGYAYLVSYQYVPRGLFKFEIDIEYAEEGFGGFSEETISPIGMILVGSGFYAGAGVGVNIVDGFDDVSDPFWVGRLGWELSVLGALSLDINANYRAGAFSELEDADTDAITVGAVARFDF